MSCTVTYTDYIGFVSSVKLEYMYKKLVVPSAWGGGGGHFKIATYIKKEYTPMSALDTLLTMKLPEASLAKSVTKIAIT